MLEHWLVGSVRTQGLMSGAMILTLGVRGLAQGRALEIIIFNHSGTA